MSVIQKLIPFEALKKTLKRFPYSAACSLVFFALVVLSKNDVFGFKNGEGLIGVSMIMLVFGFFWFGFISLMSEGLDWALARQRWVAYGGFLVFIVLFFMGQGYGAMWLLGLSIPALLLGVSVGPYVASRDNLSFWFYNRQVWQGALISIAAGIIWFAGLAAILSTVKLLFGLPVPSSVYGYLLALTQCVFVPLYTLSWVPEKYEYSDEDCHAPPQLSFILNWVLVPLALVYMIILYAYFAKIAIVGEVPKGQLAYMISAFGGIGVLTYLSAWPLGAVREGVEVSSGSGLLRFFYKLFFPALFVPIGMLAFSIYLRISEYGVTEQRYLMVVVALWLMVLAVLYTFRRPALKWIPATLAILLVFSAIGPFSALRVSEWSQMGRLERVLSENKILVDGRVVKTDVKVSYEDRKDISSIIDFLKKRRKLDRLQGWMPDLNLNNRKQQRLLRSGDIVSKMGVVYLDPYDRKGNNNVETSITLRGAYDKRIKKVEGYSYLINSQYVGFGGKTNPNANPVKPSWELRDGKDIGLMGNYKDGLLMIGTEKSGFVSFDIEQYALKELENDSADVLRVMEMTKTNGNLKVKVSLSRIHLWRDVEEGQEATEGTPFVLNGFSFEALIKD